MGQRNTLTKADKWRSGDEYKVKRQMNKYIWNTKQWKFPLGHTLNGRKRNGFVHVVRLTVGRVPRLITHRAAACVNTETVRPDRGNACLVHKPCALLWPTTAIREKTFVFISFFALRSMHFCSIFCHPCSACRLHLEHTDARSDGKCKCTHMKYNGSLVRWNVRNCQASADSFAPSLNVCMRRWRSVSDTLQISTARTNEIHVCTCSPDNL